jgi:two-component system, OmpR family, response regulator
MRLLLVEDDKLINQLLSEALVNQHYVVDVATDGQSGWEFVKSFVYDLLLVDVMLPKMDGVSLCRQLRSQGHQMPILMLTARDTTEDRVTGLDAGADDYLTKPYKMQELNARIRALLRRGNTSSLAPLLKWGSLTLDLNTCETKYADSLLRLTPKEYRLLELFMRSGSRILNRSSILENLWSFEEPPDEDAVKALVKRLRQKLKEVGVPGDPIETVYGMGYRLKASA